MEPIRKDQRLFAAARYPDAELEAEISDIASLDVLRLREAWAARFGVEAPRTGSAPLLRHMLASRMQSETFGGVDAKTKLREIASALERDGTYKPKLRRDLSPGVVITREWKGQVHEVSVVAGGFAYLGNTFKSLSEIAREITGARWSGPRFFGLDRRASRQARMTSP